MLVPIRAVLAIVILIANAWFIASRIRDRTRRSPGARIWLSGAGAGMLSAGLVTGLVLPARLSVSHGQAAPTSVVTLWLIGGALAYFGLVLLLAVIHGRGSEA
jgi:hypothetical protein